MKKRINLFAVALLTATIAHSTEPPRDYTVFVNSRMNGSYFFSQASASGASSVETINGKLPVSTAIFNTPGNALRLTYSNGVNGNWSAAVIRPRLRGVDQFNPASYFSCWLYSPVAITTGLPTVQLLYRDSTFSPKGSLKPLEANKWQRFVLPIGALGIEDPARIRDVRAVVFSQEGKDGKKHTIYVDDILFSPSMSNLPLTLKPVLRTATGYDRHIDITWDKPSDTNIRYVKIYRSEDGRYYAPVGIQDPSVNRYADYVGKSDKKFSYRISFLDKQYLEIKSPGTVVAKTRRMTDDELLTMVQEAAFRYYWEGAEVNSGLARENIPGRENMVAMGAAGFGMMALIAGTERGFITREQAVERFTRITKFLERSEKFHGAFAHFMDGPTAKVEPFFGQRDNGGDLVETSFLVQGLLTAKAYFNKNNAAEEGIRQSITQLWKGIEWSWYRRYPQSPFLYWHWSPDKEWIIDHRLIGWNETMVTYLLAIASPTYAVPPSMYYSGWASQDTIAQQYRAAWGRTKDGSMYTNGNTYQGIKLDVGVSSGGPLFFTHYSYMGYDPHQVTDRYVNYFTNNTNIARINYKYCVANPKGFKGYSDSSWGLTASDGPWRYSADEPMEHEDNGKITPTGAISSFPYTPKESMKALKKFYYDYGHFLWGEYGFRDAFDLTQNWCSDIFMGLNQAPMVVMIENYRSGLIWKLFMSNPDIREGLKKLQQEK
ncbi:hypothetical protein JMG10_09305 [Nostoc ellipsosporum NOK]|nr:hypothetical protein [Nostoc ellipsosporum NOK]